MEFSLSTLVAGFVFGTFGFYFAKQGRAEANGKRLALGISMMAYSYFVPNPWACWGVGFVLAFFAYRA